MELDCAVRSERLLIRDVSDFEKLVFLNYRKKDAVREDWQVEKVEMCERWVVVADQSPSSEGQLETVQVTWVVEMIWS